MTDVWFSVIVVGFLLTIIIVATAVFVTPWVAKINAGANVVVEINDEGAKLASLLGSKFMGRSYMDEMGDFMINDSMSEEMNSTLKKLGWALAIYNDNGLPIKKFGDVRKERGIFTDIALPGLNKGKMGVDTK
jgi:hypothetical protein